ncbi:MAG: helix-turn-helix domain-containing protein [Thermodesulfobacteriota bacterium]
MSKPAKATTPFTMVATAEIMESGMRPSEMAVYNAMRSYAHRNNVCIASIPQLARRAGLKDRRTQDIIKALEKRGAIKVVRTKGGNTANGYPRKHNVYLLLADPNTRPDANNERDFAEAIKLLEGGQRVAPRPVPKVAAQEQAGSIASPEVQPDSAEEGLDFNTKDGGKVRLSGREIAHWQEMYPNLAVQAECYTLAVRAEAKPFWTRNELRHALGGYLNKLNREAVNSQKQGQEPGGSYFNDITAMFDELEAESKVEGETLQ